MPSKVALVPAGGWWGSNKRRILTWPSVVIAPARRARDPGLNPGPGKNFSLKLLYIYIVWGIELTVMYKSTSEIKIQEF